MSILFSEYHIKGLSLKNRVVMAPMCMFCAKEDGLVTPWHVHHYVSRAVGGVGLIIIEATAVEPRGRISDTDLGIWSDEHVAGLKTLVEAVHANGAKIAIQLAHAGAKCSVPNETLISASLHRFSDKYSEPVAMTEAHLSEVVDAFGKAARRAVEIGFDAIEIHGAHGYLIHQFLSPITNHRTDVYGKDKVAFARQVLQAVKRQVPDEMPIFMRVSAEDYRPEGNHPEVMGQMMAELVSEGLDVVHVSSGGAVPDAVETYPAYQVPMAQVVKSMTNLPTIAGGLIQTPELAEAVLRMNQADLIFIGRPLLRDPYYVFNAMEALGEKSIPWPTQYHRAVSKA